MRGDPLKADCLRSDESAERCTVVEHHNDVCEAGRRSLFSDWLHSRIPATTAKNQVITRIRTCTFKVGASVGRVTSERHYCRFGSLDGHSSHLQQGPSRSAHLKERPDHALEHGRAKGRGCSSEAMQGLEQVAAPDPRSRKLRCSLGGKVGQQTPCGVESPLRIGKIEGGGEV
jgi:hypothetical protein